MIDIPQVMVKLIEAVRTIPIDVPVPRVWKKSSTSPNYMLTNAAEDFCTEVTVMKLA